MPSCGRGRLLIMRTRLFHRSLIFTLGLLCLSSLPATAQDRLCDPGDEDCRAILINYIRNETVRIDVAFWFMEDARYTAELIKKHQAGVPVRVLMDPRANADYPLNPARLSELADRRHPDAEAADQLHPPLEDDAVPRPERRRVQRRQLQRGCVPSRDGDPLRELHGRGDLLHRRHRDRQQLPDQVRRPLDQHDRVGGLRQHHDAAGAQLRHLPEGSVAELPAARELSDAFAERVQSGKAKDRRDHVSHHRPAAHRHDSGDGGAGHSGAADHRAGAIPPAEPDVALLERGSPLHGRRADQTAGACRPEPSEVGDPLRPERHHRRRPEHGDFRVLELDQPLGERTGRAQHLLDQSGTSSPGS